MGIKNWYLNQVRKHIEITSIEFPDGFTAFLDSKKIPINKNIKYKRLIDWKKVNKCHQINYENHMIENQIRDDLKISDLYLHEQVYMDFGYENPVVKIPTAFFVENWFEFVSSTNFLGSVVIVEDGSLFMEFTDDSDFLLISNFLITPTS
ncbi:hypothetical protein [Okeania sp. SIO1I7]|uniref:hypothetical protein n=1 Tax=Okeania sp. SIO1I7 TaxID=2607772 RepID=UPI0013FA2DD2|nr:hypothetical protein [Okeania sp. SIO1I7]NET28619.1 hypothetical protein [Okeania sp. SIO1I7]